MAALAVLSTAVAILVPAALLSLWRRKRARVAIGVGATPDTSVPEALHTLARGPRGQRTLAARALAEIVSGEVQVLEEILDEARGAHPEFGGGRVNDGRTVLGVVLDDLAGADDCAEAAAELLLQMTHYDTEWDDTDEWNELAMAAVAYLRDEEAAEAKLTRALAEQGKSADGVGTAVASKAAVLRRRLRGERNAAAPEDGADSFRAPAAPGMLSMNTRAFCPVCLTRGPNMVRCPQCCNVGYCSTAHLREDAKRHRAWCYSLRH